MAIRLFVTGGTIDCERIETKRYIFTQTHVPEMLKQAKNTADIEIEILMLKHSSEITDSDRNRVLQKCQSCKEYKIVITHGTYAMIKTAEFLGKNIKNKTIVFLGATVPYNQEDSDAMFNLGSAITAAQTLQKGVYIAMNGKIFSCSNVIKNKRGEFEELT